MSPSLKTTDERSPAGADGSPSGKLAALTFRPVKNTEHQGKVDGEHLGSFKEGVFFLL